MKQKDIKSGIDNRYILKYTPILNLQNIHTFIVYLTFKMVMVKE